MSRIRMSLEDRRRAAGIQPGEGLRQTPSRCTICNHPRLAEIREAILEGHTLRSVAQRFGVPWSTLQHHVAAHDAELRDPEARKIGQAIREEPTALEVAEKPHRSFRSPTEAMLEAGEHIVSYGGPIQPEDQIEPARAPPPPGLPGGPVGLFQCTRECIVAVVHYHAGDLEIFPEALDLGRCWARVETDGKLDPAKAGKGSLLRQPTHYVDQVGPFGAQVLGPRACKVTAAELAQIHEKVRCRRVADWLDELAFGPP